MLLEFDNKLRDKLILHLEQDKIPKVIEFLEGLQPLVDHDPSPVSLGQVKNITYGYDIKYPYKGSRRPVNKDEDLVSCPVCGCELKLKHRCDSHIQCHGKFLGTVCSVTIYWEADEVFWSLRKP